MNDTVSDEDVWEDYLGAIHEYTPIVHGDHKLSAVHGCEHGAIHERRAVADSSIDDYTESG